MKRVFLGGTCSSEWREVMIPLLEKAGLGYFNPVLPDSEDWNEEAQQIELNERAACDFCVYTITPKMDGVYSITEVVDDSNKRPQKVIFVVLEKDGKDTFTADQLKSLESVGLMIERNKGLYCQDLETAVKHMFTTVAMEELATNPDWPWKA